jgi:hypothetical protein
MNNVCIENHKTLKILKEHFWLLALIAVYLYLFSIYGFKLYFDLTFEGDFGRDFYYYYLVSKGQLPYIHFNWIYGPLAPLMYGLTYKLFGVNIFNAALIWYILFTIIVFGQYFLVSRFSNNFCGFLAGLIFILYYTMIIKSTNHIFGSMILTAITILMYYYFIKTKPWLIYTIAGFCFLLIMVKINMGIIILVAVFAGITVYNYFNKLDMKKSCLLTIVVVVLSAIIYGLFIYFIPEEQVNKSFPFSSSLLMGPTESLFNRLFLFDSVIPYFEDIENLDLLRFLHFFSAAVWYFVFLFLSLLAGLLIYKKEGINSYKLFFVLILFIAGLLSTHEFILVGTIYTLRYWTLPVVIPLVFFAASYFIDTYKETRWLGPVLTAFCTFLFAGLLVKIHVATLYASYPASYAPCKRAKISFVNDQWYQIFTKGINYIEQNTLKDENVLTLPYNTIYNFISQRDQPSRYTEFMYISGLSDDDQNKIIEDIENKKVNIILKSLKVSIPEKGIGEFGKTHCNILNRYINDHYLPAHEVTWYGGKPITIIYRRETPFR